MYQRFGRGTDIYGRLRGASVVGVEDFYLYSSDGAVSRPMSDALRDLGGE
jgi:hypothetical protein